MTGPEALKSAIKSLNDITEMLNTALVDLLGPDADWGDHAGVDKIPSCYLNALNSSQQNQMIAQAWAAREEANSSIAWIENLYDGDIWSDEED